MPAGIGTRIRLRPVSFSVVEAGSNFQEMNIRWREEDLIQGSFAPLRMTTS